MVASTKVMNVNKQQKVEKMIESIDKFFLYLLRYETIKEICNVLRCEGCTFNFTKKTINCTKELDFTDISNIAPTKKGRYSKIRKQEIDEDLTLVIFVYFYYILKLPSLQFSYEEIGLKTGEKEANLFLLYFWNYCLLRDIKPLEIILKGDVTGYDVNFNDSSIYNKHNFLDSENIVSNIKNICDSKVLPIF